jgi:hypothetical protein
MGAGEGDSFRTTVVILLMAFVLAGALASGITGKADARANINNYLSKGPNDFYPSGYDREGPMKLAIDTVGWNATRIAGNLGIGNGSVRTFDQASTYETDYPDKGFMCGDVSAQPWIPGLKTEPPQVEEAADENATGEVTDDRALQWENVTGRNIFSNVSGDDSGAAGRGFTGGTDNKTVNRTGEDAINQSGRLASNITNITNATNASNATNATNKTAPVNTEQARAAGENLAFAAYHPVQYLRPVKDVLYEHPLATSGTAYCELLGFETPAGYPVNVGMKCTGYGY